MIISMINRRIIEQINTINQISLKILVCLSLSKIIVFIIILSVCKIKLTNKSTVYKK
jgi:hypothetical protein